jgi:hypothetical protein
MNGVRQREAGGSQYREHVMEGRAMHAILEPESAPQRRNMTPQADRFVRISTQIGAGSELYQNQERVDPATQLKPAANFRKASEASMGNRLWTNENEFGIHEQRNMNKHELCKARSRERYFQSSISTLPGPSAGLNCVKTQQQVHRQASENSHI